MKKIKASVLAFEKKLIPSDGLMFGTTWEKRYDNSTPLKLLEKSVRGTISNRLKKAIADDPIKLDAELRKPNLQTVDSCALSSEQDTLKLNFTLKILSGVEYPSACNNEEFNANYKKVTKEYISEYKFTELAKRYVENLVNGKFLWRNRIGCDELEVQIKILNKDDEFSEKFDCLKIDGIDNDKISELMDRVSKVLSGENEFLLLDINAFAKVGKSQDVYPSEELVLDKSNSNNKGKKSKILFSVNDIAAMHSQKIGNAIRTIDTWYPKFNETNKAIAVDPYGAVTNLGIAYRNAKDNFFNLFDKFVTGVDIEENEKHFVMAVLVRGGVFGESSK